MKPSYLLRQIGVAGLLVLLSIWLVRSAFADAPIREHRVLFEENFSWITRSGADELVARAKQSGFDGLVVCVWHGRGVTWASGLAQREPRWAQEPKADPDPLAYLIRQAHAQGIEVHPWFTIALRQADIFPEYFDGVGYGDEIDKSFNVHRPEFQGFIVKVVMEVVDRYSVDGVNLDYIRAMGVCTSQYCQAKYRLEAGRDLLADVDAMHDSPQAWNALSVWNAKAVGDIVSRLSTAVRSRKPELLMSVDSHVGRRELELQGASSYLWANAGLIDLIYDMNYGKVLDLAHLASERKRLNDPRGMALLVGNFERGVLRKSDVFPRNPSRVRSLMEDAAKFGRGGFGSGLYSYTYLTPEQIAELRTLNGP